MELDVLKKVIVDVLNVDPSEIDETTTFMGDLGADSLDLFQVVMGIEEAFDIEIKAEDVEEIKTVGQAVQLIKNTKGAKGS
ncbi:MAG: acyl carrier protein [Lachnospiraceae bacterium]|nr:acyl carrier protein [Lachnospiraceae bacterium]